MSVLFKTVHGSHLYGLAHEGSDEDYYIVEDDFSSRRRKAKQTIVDGVDSVTTSLSVFMEYAGRGVPQSLEAIWSPEPEIDLLGEEFRFSFRPDYWDTQDRYQRTIKNFWKDGVENDDAKRRRHAYRLTLNLIDLRIAGIFNPRLGELDLYMLEEMIASGKEPWYFLGVGEDDLV